MNIKFSVLLKKWASISLILRIFIGVVQDSVETALNSSGDVFFTATAEYRDNPNLRKS